MASARIIFVPGMKPKPPPAAHRRELLRTLVSALARVRPSAARALRDRPECLTLVSWTYRFYGEYRDISLDLPGIERILREPEPSPDDVRDIDSLARRLNRFWHVLGDALPLLGRFIAKPQTRLTMSEALRYLKNVGGAAREIRSMLKAPLRAAWTSGERVLLIGHSLGSVIAYDALWELSHEEGETGRVDLFLTLGSPLATRFITRNLRGADRQGAERYPRNIRRWANFSAKAEMTALHPALGPVFEEMLELGLLESFEDHVALYNHFRGDLGLNVHKSYGYLAHERVAGLIGGWLEETPARGAT